MSEPLPNHDQNAKGEHCPEQLMYATASANSEEIVSRYTDYVLVTAPLYNREELKNYFRQAIQSALAPVQAELEQAKEINTSKRLLDLVRYMRSELHQADLITDDEFTWLLTAADEGKIGQGSISARRLEDYDKLRARLTQAEAASRDMAQKLEKAEAACREVVNFDWGNCGDSIDRIIGLCREAVSKP